MVEEEDSNRVIYKKNMKGELILDVRNLTVRLDGELVLENLNFQVRKGDVLTILGPNGAGKTVLLKTLLGLFPHEGEIKWKENVKVGYVPQRLPFIKDIPLGVEEFFKLKEAKEKIKKVLFSVGIKDQNILKKKIGDLSSGQFQRILIAFALIDEPQVLLFDEPTAGIDIGAEETIYTFLEKLRKEKNLTILLVTHDLSVVYKFASSCLCLNKRMLCFGKAKNLDAQTLAKLYGGKIKIYEHRHD
ncbi:MAG: metal ABC transporter ATP-binding protein [Candidatus Nanoarchaeia archaeon]